MYAVFLLTVGILLPLWLTRELEEPYYTPEYQAMFPDIWDED